MEALRFRPFVQSRQRIAQPSVNAVRCICFGQNVQRFPINGNGPLQFTLLCVQTAQLEESRNTGTIVGAAIAQTDTFELGAFVQNGSGLFAATERDQRCAEIQVGDCEVCKGFFCWLTF